jgi:uncharacterized membrane protein YjgN (DUF898 family)
MDESTPGALAPSAPQYTPLEFTGDGWAYFRIWVVNVALSVLTLGIYSAWAKVRMNRYFYGHTQLAGASFEYLAEPMAILKGRIIAVLALVIYSAVTQSPTLWALIPPVLFMFALPWLVNRSLAFRLVNTRYRNVRFSFTGAYGRSFKVHVLWLVAASITLGALLPLALQRQYRFLVEHTRYGLSEFATELPGNAFYLPALQALGMVLLAGALGALLPALLPVLMPVAVVGAYAHFSAQTLNRVLGASQLGDHRFEGRLETLPWAWVLISNAVLAALSLGLAIPWARIRAARYKLSHVGLWIDGDLEEFLAAEVAQSSALGEELGEAFDLDIGL